MLIHDKHRPTTYILQEQFNTLKTKLFDKHFFFTILLTSNQHTFNEQYTGMIIYSADVSQSS